MHHATLQAREAKAPIERQRAEEQAVLEAQTKSRPRRAKQALATGRRVRAHGVRRRATSRSGSHGDGRSAGGVDVPCELQRIGYDEIVHT